MHRQSGELGRLAENVHAAGACRRCPPRDRSAFLEGPPAVTIVVRVMFVLALSLGSLILGRAEDVTKMELNTFAQFESVGETPLVLFLRRRKRRRVYFCLCRDTASRECGSYDPPYRAYPQYFVLEARATDACNLPPSGVLPSGGRSAPPLVSLYGRSGRE